MNIALITAGGKGTRVGQDIPKQFVSVKGKPIIIHTLEKFQKHPAIDAIVVVCLDGWRDVLQRYAVEYHITKLNSIIPGGATGQDSIRNGVMSLYQKYDPDSTVLVHDAVRPMISADMISNCIALTERHGNAVACVPCLEPLMRTEDGLTSSAAWPREKFMRAQAPQGYHLKDLYSAHQRAVKENRYGMVDTCSLLVAFGYKIHFFSGSLKNLKITHAEDIDIFKALLDMAI